MYLHIIRREVSLLRGSASIFFSFSSFFHATTLVSSFFFSIIKITSNYTNENTQFKLPRLLTMFLIICKTIWALGCFLSFLFAFICKSQIDVMAGSSSNFGRERLLKHPWIIQHGQCTGCLLKALRIGLLAHSSFGSVVVTFSVARWHHLINPCRGGMHGAAEPILFFINCTLKINIDTLITGWACPRCSFVVPYLI